MIGLVLNDRYKLLERVGSGGMSVVYKSQDLLLGRLVAVKLLHESFSGDVDFLQRFRQEAYAAASLQHPNIVTVHDIGEDAHRQYIVMEFVDGLTLKQIIRQHNEQKRLMPTNRILDLTIQICSGIGYAHRAHLVHCDVKPQNVLVTRDDQIKVADFGIARAMTEASQQAKDSLTWGTPHYFSPEQASGEPPTPASDVYSIGIMMFEMLTGELPFTAESQTALALKHIQDQPPHVYELNPTVPLELDLIVDKVLSKEPQGRYRRAGQLERVLRTYRKSSEAVTIPQSSDLLPTAAVTGAATAEQQTMVFPRPTNGPISRRTDQGTIKADPPAKKQVDWLAIGLGIIALLALLGLIPLWYFVYTTYTG